MHAAGATLVELIVSIVIISIGLAGILTVMDRNARSSADPVVQHQAIAAAEAYIEEILLRDFNDPDGTEVGETRPTFDDVDDYHNLPANGCITTTPACPVLGNCACDQNGAPLSALNGYAVNVTVTATPLNGVAAQRVDVSVTAPFGQNVTLTGYRTNY